MINNFDYHKKFKTITFEFFRWKWYMFREVYYLEEIADTIGNKQCWWWIWRDIILLQLAARKKTLISYRILHNKIVQFKKTTQKRIDAIRKVKDELQLDLKSTK